MNLIALDLDGTTLDSNGVLRDVAKEALQKINQVPENILVFCSGRPLSGVRPFVEAVGINEATFHVTNNGAAIENIQGQCLQECFLELKDYRRVLQYCRQHNYLMIAVTAVGVYTSFKEINTSALKFSLLTNNSLIFQEVEDFSPETKFSKFLICDEPQKIEQYKEEVINHFEKNYACVQGHEEFIEFAKLGNSKGKSLSKLVKYYKIADDNVYIVGDNENDWSMFQRYRQSVAMGNAVAELKKIARWQCGVNDQAGIVEALTIIEKNIQEKNRRKVNGK